MKFSQFILLFLLLILFSMSISAEELISLKTRGDEKQNFIFIAKDAPVASVVLFAGGKGVLKLSTSGVDVKIEKTKNNFLVRSRNLFAESGFQVAVVDAPTDHQGKKGMMYGFRTSDDHVEDINHVIAFLKRKADVPVWLVGTSRGSESAAHIAINAEQSLKGLVLTSSLTSENSTKGIAVTDMDLSKINIPVLIASHAHDDCHKTPPKDAHLIARALVNSVRKEVKFFEGGNEPISKPCNGLSYHGFLGIEAEVVTSVADFIKAK